MLWNAISSFLRGQILTKMFSKSILMFMLIFICGTSCRSTRVYFIFLAVFWKFSGYQFQLSIGSVMFGVIHGIIKNSFENLRTDVKIVIDFSYPDRILIGIRDFQAKSDESRRVLHIYG